MLAEIEARQIAFAPDTQLRGDKQDADRVASLKNAPEHSPVASQQMFPKLVAAEQSQ